MIALVCRSGSHLMSMTRILPNDTSWVHEMSWLISVSRVSAIYCHRVALMSWWDLILLITWSMLHMNEVVWLRRVMNASVRKKIGGLWMLPTEQVYMHISVVTLWSRRITIQWSLQKSFTKIDFFRNSTQSCRTIHNKWKNMNPQGPTSSTFGYLKQFG